MKYTKEERLDIGRRIYDGEITKYQAANKYGIGEQTARRYMRMYRDANGLAPKNKAGISLTAIAKAEHSSDLRDFESMTKEELIIELVKARIAEARLKKGYEVKGDGSVILYGSRNTK